LAGVTEARAYPVSAKYHMDRSGVPMTLVTRTRDISCLNENAICELESLMRMEHTWRTRLGMKEN
jgi:4-hydroxy-tetrahydrodipicolinate synthase